MYVDRLTPSIVNSGTFLLTTAPGHPLMGDILSEERKRAAATIQIDNERVRVTEWRFAPDAETGWHRHEYDYVIVPQTSGSLLLESRDGTSLSALQSGKPYFRQSGVEHNVINATATEFVFIEVELKSWATPSSRPVVKRVAVRKKTVP